MHVLVRFTIFLFSVSMSKISWPHIEYGGYKQFNRLEITPKLKQVLSRQKTNCLFYRFVYDL